MNLIRDSSFTLNLVQLLKNLRKLNLNPKHNTCTVCIFVGELNTGIWLGGNKLSGTWQWDGLDKSAIKDVGGDQWIHGQPDDAWGGEDCLQSHNWGSLWNDLGCNHHLEYVCEKSHPYQ